MAFHLLDVDNNFFHSIFIDVYASELRNVESRINVFSNSVQFEVGKKFLQRQFAHSLYFFVREITLDFLGSLQDCLVIPITRIDDFMNCLSPSDESFEISQDRHINHLFQVYSKTGLIIIP